MKPVIGSSRMNSNNNDHTWSSGDYNIYLSGKFIKKAHSDKEVSQFLHSVDDSQLYDIKITKDNLQRDYRQTEDEVTLIYINREKQRRGIVESAHSAKFNVKASNYGHNPRYKSEVTTAFSADNVVDECYRIYELIEEDDGYEELDCIEVKDDKHSAIEFAKLYSTQNNCPTHVVHVSTTDSGDIDTEVIWESFMKNVDSSSYGGAFDIEDDHIGSMILGNSKNAASASHVKDMKKWGRKLGNFIENVYNLDSDIYNVYLGRTNYDKNFDELTCIIQITSTSNLTPREICNNISSLKGWLDLVNACPYDVSDIYPAGERYVRQVYFPDDKVAFYLTGDEFEPLSNDRILESTEVVNSGYSPDLLNDLVNHYRSFDTMSYEEIWDEIVAEYNNEDLANDVLESLDDYEEDNTITI